MASSQIPGGGITSFANYSVVAQIVLVSGPFNLGEVTLRRVNTDAQGLSPRSSRVQLMNLTTQRTESAPIVIQPMPARASNIGNTHLSNRTVICPRCEREVQEWDFQSHSTSHASEILDGFLFLGGERNARNERELTTRLNITHIVNVAWEVGNKFEGRFKYCNVRLSDVQSEPLDQLLDVGLAAIDEAKRSGGRVLVHCVQGISRSASLVIAYLMKDFRMSLDEAVDYVRARRPIIEPNAGFMQQLREFESRLRTQRLQQIDSKVNTAHALLAPVVQASANTIGALPQFVSSESSVSIDLVERGDLASTSAVASESSLAGRVNVSEQVVIEFSSTDDQSTGASEVIVSEPSSNLSETGTGAAYPPRSAAGDTLD